MKELIIYALHNLRAVQDPTGDWLRYHQSLEDVAIDMGLEQEDLQPILDRLIDDTIGNLNESDEIINVIINGDDNIDYVKAFDRLQEIENEIRTRTND